VVLIAGITDFSTALVKELESGKISTVKIADLRPYIAQEEESGKQNLASLADPAVREDVEFRLEVIKSLVGKAGRTRADVEARARECNLNASTLYNWLDAYEPERESANLARKKRSDTGGRKLNPIVEIVLGETLNNLKPEDKTLKKIKKKVDDAIENLNLAEARSNDLKSSVIEFPKDKTILHSNLAEARSNDPKSSVIEFPKDKTILHSPDLLTIKSRLEAIPARKTYARLHGEKAAEERFDPILGKFPGADYPLAILQIDHTLLDIILVDEIERKPIRRPWITLALDPCNRVVRGFEISEDPPGAMSTGLCLVHAILPKENYLAKHGCTGEWPCWGKPDAVHGDNAFRMGMLKQASKDHGFDLIWRPVKKPRFGGHIESYFGTLGDAIHFLPGTTFSDPKERGLYDSEGKACFTLDELKKWVLEKILAYHAERHSQLGVSPIESLKQGVFKGTKSHPPVGLQMRIDDPAAQTRLRLDFTPFVLRTIQRYGVEIDKIFYYHDVLRRWIKAKRKFRFPRYLRNLNSISFFDPDLEDYSEIPTRDPTFPAMSIWDLHKVRALAKAEGMKDSAIDEEYIKARYLRMREIEGAAVKKTKAMRTLDDRRRQWEASEKPKLPPAPKEVAASELNDDEDFERVEGFKEDE
jgi:putative transposase